MISATRRGRSGGSDPFDSTTDAANGVTETTTMVGQNKSAQILIQYTDLEFDFKKIFGDVLEEVPELESVLRDGLRPLLSLIKGVTMLVNVNKDGRMTLAPNPFRFNQGLPIAL